MLVKDIGTQLLGYPPNSSDPNGFVGLETSVVFNAAARTAGGLWRSDGTKEGTAPLFKGAALGLTRINNKAVFGGGGGVWRTDGTAGGTVKLTSASYGGPSYDAGFGSMAGMIFFSGGDATHGYELWKSNGTPGNAEMVKDIAPGICSGYPCSSDPSGFAVVNDTLFFVAGEGIHGLELWKSDGTEAGTVLVKDINPNGNGVGDADAAGFVYDPQLTAVNGSLVFLASDRGLAPDLWRSDGTAAGTVMLRQFQSGNGGDGRPILATTINGTLFFSADDGSHGMELWKTNGTTAGTVLVKDIQPGSGGSTTLYRESFAELNGKLYFGANDGTHGAELWTSDGTASGTMLVKDINPSSGSGPWHITNAGGTLFFTARDGTNGEGLWRSDGTPAGTILVRAINPNAPYAIWSNLAVLGRRVFFNADDGIYGREPWMSDGTSAGTVLVRDIIGNDSSQPYAFTRFGSTAFFVAGDGYTPDLWRSDGTDAGTSIVATHVCNTSRDTGPTEFAGELYFKRSEPTTGCELWKTDGTPAGTHLVADISPGSDSGISIDTKLVEMGGAIYFGTGGGLWRSDGTSAGTVLVSGGFQGGGPVAVVGSNVFFVATDGTHGYELWKSDGTPGGTGMVRDIFPGPTGGYYDDFTVVGSHLFFSINKDGDIWWLGISDGSASGTGSLAMNRPLYLANVNGTLFFSGRDSGDRQLWRSDGASTYVVKSIASGGPSRPAYLVNVNGTLFFVADYVPNTAQGTRLWKSDGTAAGTAPVAPSPPMPAVDEYNPIVPLANVNGRLFMAAKDDSHGTEVWRSDGSAAGTVLLADVVPGLGSSEPRDFTVVGSSVFFSATDDDHGTEPWVIPNIVNCGDAIIDAGEQCDDGNPVNTDACKNDCTSNVCGDGATNVGVEDCDDGNTAAGDCCSAVCTFESAGAPCVDDGNPCSIDECDGTGTCLHVTAAAAGTVCRPAAGPCDVPEACDGTSSVCPADEFDMTEFVCEPAAGECPERRCSGSSPLCPACQATTTTSTSTTTTTTLPQYHCTGAPEAGCGRPVEAGKASLMLKNKFDDDRDQLVWKWNNGAATAAADFGDPVTMDHYAFCLYDESSAPTLLYEMKLRSPSRLYWKGLGNPPLSKGVKYSSNLPDGIIKMSLKPGAAGKAKILVNGKGSRLPFVPGPAIVPVPLRVQLQAENGHCWEARYTAASVNDGELFRAKSE